MPPVVLYGTRFCSFCLAARRLLDEKGITFEDISVDTDLDLRIDIMEKSGQRTVPQIWVGSTHVGGYSDLQALENSGDLDELLSIDLEQT
jgi:glutaredoxin 3